VANYKRGLAVVFGVAIALTVSYVATYPRFHPQASVAPVIAAIAPLVPATVLGTDLPLPASANDPLAWRRLTPQQQLALAPYVSVWDTFSQARKRKWLKIAARFQKMSPDAQKNLQSRMTEWVNMTPEQRKLARENYVATKDLPLQEREKAWSAYQLLPEEQKEKLAAANKRRHPTVVSAPPSGKRDPNITRLVNAHGVSEALPVPPLAPPMPAKPPAPLASASVVPSHPAPIMNNPRLYDNN
jgi:hypothetical protein